MEINGAAARIENLRARKVFDLVETVSALAVEWSTDAAAIAVVLEQGGVAVSRTGAWIALTDLCNERLGSIHQFPSDLTRGLVLAALAARAEAMSALPADPFAGLPIF